MFVKRVGILNRDHADGRGRLAPLQAKRRFFRYERRSQGLHALVNIDAKPENRDPQMGPLLPSSELMTQA